MKTIDQNEHYVIQEEMDKLRTKYKSMILSSINKANDCEVSYAPFIYYQNQFYILISETAAHFQNLIINPKIQGMLIEDENDASSQFLRKRLIYHFEASECQDEVIKNEFVHIHGPIAEMVLNLDFHIFHLKVVEGRIIIGAGRAYFLNGNEKVIGQNMGK